MPLALAAKEPIVAHQISRLDHIRSRLPQAANVIRQIEQRTQPFKFGISRPDLQRQYRFIRQLDVEEFFDTYLHTSEDSLINEQYIKSCIAGTLNRNNVTGNPNDDSLKNFAFVCDELIQRIEEEKTRRLPFIRFILAPTGSGKTAFSKALITSSIRQLWAATLIPCRIEYSKFVGMHPEHDDRSLYNFIRQCQLRDFLIWYFFSGDVVADIVNDLRGLNLPIAIEARLIDLKNCAASVSFDGDATTLGEVSRTWFSTVGYLDADLSKAILIRLNEHYHRSFLVSFDGFDIIDVEDFLLDGGRQSPIELITKLLNGVLEKVVFNDWPTAVFDCHFILYMRDTTYTRLRLRWRSKKPIKTLWIAPPTYRSMVDKISSLVGADLGEQYDAEACQSLSLLVDKSFREYVFRGFTTTPAARPASSVFCWNARNIKRHIGRLLFWSLEKISWNHELRSKLEVAGVGEKWLWNLLISESLLKDMPGYQVLEELFLDNTRQLRPQLCMSSAQVSRALDTGDLMGAVCRIEDYEETVGFFDCMFNYMTKNVLARNDVELPALLILIRICQLILYDGPARLAQIKSFLLSLGYQIDDGIISFFLYTLLRNEVLSWRVQENFGEFADAIFYIGLRGRILLNRMIFSASYLSESMLISELPINGLGKELQPRDFLSNQRWAFDCLFNSVIAVNIIDEIECAEAANALAAHMEFGQYKIAARIAESISAEAARILNSPGAKTEKALRHRGRLSEKLNMIRVRRPDVMVPIEF